MLGHWPLPAKITQQVLEPIHLRERYGDDPDVEEIYDDVIEPHAARPGRAAERAAPAGDRLRVEQKIDVDASREDAWELVRDPSNYPRLMAGITRFETQGDEEDAEPGQGSRYSMRMHVGSADVGGLVEVVEFDEPGDLAWTSVTGIDQRGRWRLRENDEGGTTVTLRLQYGSPGGVLAGGGRPPVGADGVGAPEAIAGEPETRAGGRSRGDR